MDKGVNPHWDAASYAPRYGHVDVGDHWRRYAGRTRQLFTVVTRMSGGVDKGVSNRYDATWDGFVGPRCGQPAQGGRGDAAVIVGGTRAWDGQCCCWTTARKRGIVMWGCRCWILSRARDGHGRHQDVGSWWKTTWNGQGEPPAESSRRDAIWD